MGCIGISNPGRVAQLILRSPAGVDLIVLDILPKHCTDVSQGIILGTDIEDLYAVPFETPLKSWAYQEGCTPSEFPRKKERRPKITLITKAATQQAWEQIETLLWSVLDNRWDCFLRLYDADSNWRELRVRLLGEPPSASPLVYGARTFHAWEGISLLAYDPFWYSEPYTVAFTRDDMTDDGAGNYTIDVPISNETDQLGFLEWNSGELTATPETWSFQDGEAVTDVGDPVMIALPELAGANKSFWVQTKPMMYQLWVKDQGQDWARMRSRTFTKAVAANTPDVRTIRVKLTGGHAASSMMVTIPRRWDRPFGGQLPIVAQMMVGA